jgi:hypothetical protein
MILKLIWGSALGRIVSVALVALAALGVNNMVQRAKGGQAVIEKSKKAGKIANAKAAKSHAAAERPGAAERVRRLHCRDC